MDPQNPNNTINEKNVRRESLEIQIPQHLRAKITVDMWNRLTYEQKDILSNIDKLPEKLLGVVPESVWDTLDLNQKIEFLYTHEVLEKGSFEIDTGMPSEEGFQEFREQLGDNSPDSNIEGESKFEKTESEKTFEKLKSEVREIGEIEKNEDAEDQLPPDDVERIKQETGYTFSSDQMPTFAGYQPDESFLNEVNVRASDSPKKATTWTANIIQKFWNSISS